ncbi:MAG: ATP-binding protein [Chloroflexota bacterium]
MPERALLGYSLFFLYFLVAVLVLWHTRRHLRRTTRHQWAAVVGLSLASLTISQLLPISLPTEGQLPPLGVTQEPQTLLIPFGAVPFLLASATLNPAAALIVGLFSGIGRALWHTHHIFDPFYFAFAACLVSWLLRQNYVGRIYQLLRQPLVSGPLSMSLLVPMLLPAFFAYGGREASSLAAFDWAISTTAAQFLPLLLEGVLSGGIVSLILIGVPQWRFSPSSLEPAPHYRSLRSRLLVNFGVFAVLLSTILVAVVFTLSVWVATRLSVSQMAHDARAVSQQIPEFRNQMQNLLQQYGSDPVLIGEDEEAQEEYLAQLVRTAGSFYRRIIVVDASGAVDTFYPNRDTEEIALTALEQQAVSDALSRGAPSVTPAQLVDDDHPALSFVVPVEGEEGHPVAALVGRVPGIALGDLVVGLQGTVGEGSGFIVDERDQIIAHPDQAVLMDNWSAPAMARRSLAMRVETPGTAYEGLHSGTNARELVYLLEGPDHPWTVIITVPYQVVLRLALQISGPLIGVLAIAMLLFGLNLLYLGRGITSPLGELVQASQQLADGRWDVTVPFQEKDEVGQLGEAFERMRRSMQRHFNEMNLMLEVSRDISTSIDIQEGLPVILRGAVRGTGAVGVRATLRNPNGRHPLRFGEGPAAEVMAPYDRAMALLVQIEDEIALSSPEQVRVGLRLSPDQEAPVQSLVALALYAKEHFQGVLWLGYREPHEFSSSELDLLRTFASQASVLIENARLFAQAERQWRQLAAVISSTSDAVIVTDPTERILLLNPAMIDTFNLRESEVIHRPVTDVINNDNLVQALTEREDRVRNLEIQVEDGRILYASVSTIRSNDGQALGRVAVLHDITHLKELDEMKSEFVSTVSHDLRGPLTFMRGYLTMLPMVGDINDKQQEYLEKILSGVQQMSTLIENLLDLGRIEAGVFLMQDRIKAKEMLRSVADEMTALAATAGLRLNVSVTPGTPAVYGDASWIRRAVANLVSNAIKYAPNSGVVTLHAEQDGDEVVFSVEDHGPGIARQDQIRLFEKFYQVKSKGRNASRGSGLGLAIVKSIVERHGGRVWCLSRPGRGSTFYFSLPLGKPSPGSEPTA